jgi:hypothetical protein
MNYYTYAYLREDGTPYYIGKGKDDRAYKKGRGQIKPPKDKNRIIFLKQNLTEEEAFRHEKYMISIFGRKDLGNGILRNRTDGGEGASNVIRSEETRKKMSEAKMGNRNGMFGHNLSEENRKKLKERMSGSKNNMAKTILIVNINGENYIVRGEFIQFCKNKNIPYVGLTKRKQRGSKTPTKCGWSYFDITNKSESEVEELKNKFILKHKNRFSLNLVGIEIPPDIKVSSKSINLVFNLIREKIENENDIVYFNNNKYTKITEEEFKKNGVSAKTACRAIKVLKIYEIVNVEKLNKSSFNHSNYYSIVDKN